MEFLNGQITPLSAIALIIIGVAFSMAGGALAGMRIGAKDLGPSLAALMGALFGTAGALPGVLVGLIVLALLR